MEIIPAVDEIKKKLKLRLKDSRKLTSDEIEEIVRYLISKS